MGEWIGIEAGIAQIAAHYGVRHKHDTRFPCPVHGGKGKNLSLKAGDDRIRASCYSAGCSYAEIAAVIESETGLRLSPGGAQGPFSGVSGSRPPQPPKKRRSERPDWRPAAFGRLMSARVRVPDDPKHPARRWAERFSVALTERLVWIPSRAFPSNWQDERPRPVGAIAGAVTPIDAPADVRGLALVCVGADGRPAGTPDKRTMKRSEDMELGGCVVLVQTGAVVLHVVEGLKDGLSVAGDWRTVGNAVAAAIGTSGLKSPELAIGAAKKDFLRVVLWADANDSKGEGLDAAQEAARNALAAGLNAEIWQTPDGYDPADAPRHIPEDSIERPLRNRHDSDTD